MAQCNDEVESNSAISNGSEDDVISIDIATDSIVASLRNLVKTKSSSSSQHNIYKVDKSLRSVNPLVYTPQVISIGPYHRNTDNLTVKKRHKEYYVGTFFSRIKLDLMVAVQKVRSWEDRVRKCYSEYIKMDEEEFVKLILMDGCFVVEYFLRLYYYHEDNFGTPKDVLVPVSVRTDLLSDLKKLENQLPFFVLDGLYQLYSPHLPKRHMSFFQLSRYIFGLRSRENISGISCNEINHFVHLLWLEYNPSNLRYHLLDYSHEYIKPPSATDLHEAGVIFKKAGGNKCIVNVITAITFQNGVLMIPNFEINNQSEAYLRNLIAFEKCHQSTEKYVTHFAKFMDCLINKEKDVSLLSNGGIITHHLGSDENVSKLFNSLCNQIDNIDGINYFNHVSRNILEFYNNQRHWWMASLKRDYFNTPWASISFVAAVSLLLLTLIQTIFSVLSYIHI